MLDVLKQLLVNQFEAALSTLGWCMSTAPDAIWQGPVVRYPFNQVAFHTLFYADYYLGPNADALRNQPFHTANPQLFGDYEELEDREPTSVYEKDQLTLYLEFCRAKAQTTIAAETETTFAAQADFPRRTFTRAELHVYNIRHIQHHAAQLIARLRLDTTIDIPWIASGRRTPELS